MAKKKSSAKKVATKKGESKKRTRKKTGTTCPDPNHYCEFYCSGGTWFLVGENHSSSYQCPAQLPGTCTGSGYTCTSPFPSRAADGADEISLNTGNYVLWKGWLYLIRGRYDAFHYCPPKIRIRALLRREPELYVLLKFISRQRKVVSVTVNVKAWERTSLGNKAARKKITRKKAAPKKKHPKKTRRKT